MTEWTACTCDQTGDGPHRADCAALIESRRKMGENIERLVQERVAEATAAAEQRLRERIEALTLDPRFNDHYHRGWGKHRAAVLALLSGGSPATPGATGTTANETPPTGYPAPAASPRQGEPVDVALFVLIREAGDAAACPYGGHLSGCDHRPQVAAAIAALSEPAEAGEPA